MHGRGRPWHTIHGMCSGLTNIIWQHPPFKKLGKNDREIKVGMENKINEVGSTLVSKHCCDPTTHSIFDVAPSSIPDQHKKDFVEALKKMMTNGDVRQYFTPPEDPAYHIEVVL